MLFYGPDFDMACHFGQKLAKGLDDVARLASVIRSSGRRVVFTVAPNKSMVENRLIRHSQLPQGSCDSTGLREQAQVLDKYPDPSYLPLRKPLVDNGVAPYYLTDPHWSTIGGSVYSAQVAALLDPHAARAQRYVSTTQTINGLLALDAIPETAPAVEPGSAITVRTARGSVDWAGLPETVVDHSWVSTPVRRTVPGHTLLIGDSFTQYALGTLRPVFRQGRFIWIDHFDDRTGAQAIKQADTVVIEVAQFLLQHSSIGTKEFRVAVRAALRHHHVRPAIGTTPGGGSHHGNGNG
jgi:hypothetical protein